MEVTRRRGRRCKKLLDDLKDRRGYSHLKEESLDRTMWRNRFGKRLWTCRQTEYWMNEGQSCHIWYFFTDWFSRFYQIQLRLSVGLLTQYTLAWRRYKLATILKSLFIKSLSSRILIKHIKGFEICKMRAKRRSAQTPVWQFFLYWDYVHYCICIALGAIFWLCVSYL
jgi:hypothetical protein